MFIYLFMVGIKSIDIHSMDCIKDKNILLYFNESNKDVIESISKGDTFQNKIKQLSKTIFSSINRQLICQ